MHNEVLAFFDSQLFHDVQMFGMFTDSKTFADATPNASWQTIYADYDSSRQDPDFDLAEFVRNHFCIPTNIEFDQPLATKSVADYIESLWTSLEKQPDSETRTSLIPLKHPYIVPGGRFREIYYWDSYFSALGLVRTSRNHLLESMIRNFIAIQNEMGSIPNGNRYYYWSRSQPPVLSLMIELLLAQNHQGLSDDFIPLCSAALEKEHQFWMLGGTELDTHNLAHARAVRMPDGEILNRYWDNSAKPRPESYREDIEAASSQISEEHKTAFYRNIRAACESGWDFSSRWFDRADDFQSIRTTQIVPVDLNSLLYKLEHFLSELFDKQGNREKSAHYSEQAKGRRLAINKYLYNQTTGFYHDYDIQKQATTNVQSLAAVVPLFARVADIEHALSVTRKLEGSFLVEGGLLTTLNFSCQQWDAPNGWAPLHWFAVKGLKAYDQDSLARKVIAGWLHTVDAYYSNSQQLMEKYDVSNPTKPAAGGEYEVQHGFGWTNGVTAAFRAMQDESQ